MASASDDGTVRVWGPAPFTESQEAEKLGGKSYVNKLYHQSMQIWGVVIK